MIAAMDRRRVIGKKDGGIPWHLPRDVRHFREYTQGKHLLLGRRTYEEMKGWFSDHTPIVMTHDPEYQVEDGKTAHSVEEAVTEAFEDGAEELVVAGGARVFAAALPYADELVLTKVETDAIRGTESLEGVPQFPDYEEEIVWETESEDHYAPDAENEVPMAFIRLRRVQPSSLRPRRFHLL